MGRVCPPVTLTMVMVGRLLVIREGGVGYRREGMMDRRKERAENRVRGKIFGSMPECTSRDGGERNLFK